MGLQIYESRQQRTPGLSLILQQHHLKLGFFGEKLENDAVFLLGSSWARSHLPPGITLLQFPLVFNQENLIVELVRISFIFLLKEDLNMPRNWGYYLHFYHFGRNLLLLSASVTDLCCR